MEPSCIPIDGATWQHQATRAGHRASFRDFLLALRDDRTFRARWSTHLAELPAGAIRWELPGLSSADLDRPFACVSVRSDTLARYRADARPFSEHFGRADPVVTFDNLGGDATLVVPQPVVSHDAYTHLTAFLRGAPAEQQHALWHQAAAAALDLVKRRRIYLNTAGLGVAWLHIRVDSRPKYYHHAPYRKT